MRRSQTLLSTAALVLILVVSLFLVVSGCDTVDDDLAGSAELSVLMTDAPFPFDLVESANVTIAGIAAENDAEGRIELSDNTLTLDLLDLAGGVTTALATDVDVPAGVYSRFLLDVSDASATLVDDQTFDVTVPSGTIQILLNDLVLEEGESATVFIDFDVSRSFDVLGNPSTPAGISGFNFTPVVRPIGYVSDDDRNDEGAELQGAIEAVGPDYIDVGGTRYFTTGATEIEDGSEASLVEGVIVEIEFVEDDGRYVATEIDIEDDEGWGVREVHGTITDVEVVDGRTFLVIDETSFEVTTSTRFDGLSGVGDIVAGETFVEIDYYEGVEGWIATEVELDDTDDDSDDVDDSDDDSDDVDD